MKNQIEEGFIDKLLTMIAKNRIDTKTKLKLESEIESESLSRNWPVYHLPYFDVDIDFSRLYFESHMPHVPNYDDSDRVNPYVYSGAIVYLSLSILW